MKNWQKVLAETDDGDFQAATQALAESLETLMINQAVAEAEHENLMGQIPDLLAVHDEAVMFGGPKAEEAKQTMGAHLQMVEDCEHRIKSIRETLSRERFSPTIGNQSLIGWETGMVYRANLLALMPDALKELDRAQAAYLKVVAKVGELGRKIARVEEVVMDGARPFMAEKPHMDPTPPAKIIMDPQTIQRVYDPDGRPPITGVAVLQQAEPNADSVLEILKKGDRQ
jgi:hypothetical protein